MKIVIGIIFILHHALFANQNQIADTKITDYPIASYQTDYAAKEGFNKEISLAALNKKQWPFQPLSVVQEFITEPLEAQVVNINIAYEKGEAPLHVEVTIFQDGFLDDSIRGAWQKFYLHRVNMHSPWQIKEIRTASLCYRGKNQEHFQKQPCP